MCWFMKSETSSAPAPEVFRSSGVLVGVSGEVGFGLERLKLTPKAAWPMTSVAKARERLEKMMSSSWVVEWRA